jgi:hypothetical protein
MFFDLLPVAPEAVVLIWDVYPRSRIRIFPSRIQGLKDAGSQIRIHIKECKYLYPTNNFKGVGNIIHDV